MTFFEVISLSAPHIYHSALPLSPQTSIIREMYKQYTHPLPRVVRGLPSSWDPTAVISHSDISPYNAVWSPCNRVIAIVDDRAVVILDAATLSRLDTFEIPSARYYYEYWQPSFSPDGHCLTLLGVGELISWDLQTGGPLGAIPSGFKRGADPNLGPFSSTYSEDGKAIAVACSSWNSHSFDRYYYTFIRTYDLSRTEAGPRCVPEGRIIEPIWTHGKCIRFVTINPGSVAVSEVEFTLKNPPVEVESLPISDKIVGGERFLFLPSLSRLAFLLRDTIQVWDAKAAKLLLKSAFKPCDSNSSHLPAGSFSSDGRFFACLDESTVVLVWKESPTGYVLHQKLQFVTSNLSILPRISPSGESIFVSSDQRAFHLWHTRDQVPFLPSVSACNFHKNNFTLAFSPDERSAAFAREGGSEVTIFHPLAGDLQLAVDTDMRVVCLGMTGSALIVVGEEKIGTWDLPGGDCTFNASIDDSVRTTTLDRNQGTLDRDQGTPELGSISPNFSRIAVLSGPSYNRPLRIYDIFTGRCLTSAEAGEALWVAFTQDGHEVWTFSTLFGLKGWEIVEDNGSGPIRLEPRDRDVYPSGALPFVSPRGYEVTGDGWVLSVTQKRLLWLPHHWRSQAWQVAWSGQFLGLLHGELSEVVILEFPE